MNSNCFPHQILQGEDNVRNEPGPGRTIPSLTRCFESALARAAAYVPAWIGGCANDSGMLPTASICDGVVMEQGSEHGDERDVPGAWTMRSPIAPVGLRRIPWVVPLSG